MELVRKFPINLRLVKTSGEIEAIGQSQFNMEVTKYAYIRLRNKDKTSVVINNITVENKFSSYLEVGLDCSLYILERGSRGNWLVGLKTTKDAIGDSRCSVGRLPRSFKAFLWVLFAIVAYNLSMIWIWFLPVLVACGAWFAYAAHHSMPSERDLRAALSAEGLRVS